MILPPCGFQVFPTVIVRSWSERAERRRGREKGRYQESERRREQSHGFATHSAPFTGKLEGGRGLTQGVKKMEKTWEKALALGRPVGPRMSKAASHHPV